MLNCKNIEWMKKFLTTIFCFSVLVFTASAQGTSAVAAAAPRIDFGNTAWILVATALVMLMTIPGLALFYGGLVRRKNVLNILMQCFIITAAVSIEWVVCGYSLAFGSSKGFLAPYIGGCDWFFLKGIKITDVSPYFISQPTARIDRLLAGMKNATRTHAKKMPARMHARPDASKSSRR